MQGQFAALFMVLITTPTFADEVNGLNLQDKQNELADKEAKVQALRDALKQKGLGSPSLLQQPGGYGGMVPPPPRGPAPVEMSEAPPLPRPEILGPVAPAPAPAPGPGIAQIGSSSADLTALSKQMTEAAQSARASANRMDTMQKHAESQEEAARTKSNQAEDAEAAHLKASDALAEASDLAEEASRARAEANRAVLDMKTSKTSLGEMTQKEFNARVACSDQAKHMKGAQVAFETSSFKAESKKVAAASADQRASDSRDAKMAADEKENEAQRDLEREDEKLNRLIAEATERKAAWEEAKSKQQQAEAALKKAQEGANTLKNALGEKQAERAKIEVMEQNVDKDRQMVAAVYRKLQEEYHTADENAQQAAALAKAAEANSEDMAGKALESANVYWGKGNSHYSPGAGVMPGYKAAGPAAAR